MLSQGELLLNLTSTYLRQGCFPPRTVVLLGLSFLKDVLPAQGCVLRSHLPPPAPQQDPRELAAATLSSSSLA